MRNIITSLLLIALVFIANSQNSVYHAINANVNSAKSTIEVVDSISTKNLKQFKFELNANFSPKILNKDCKLKLLKTSNSKAVGIDRDESGKLKTNVWQIIFDSKNKPLYFVLSYSGFVDSTLSKSKSNYQRGFTYSDGIISKKGVYLAGSTYWVPNFNDKLFSYKLTVNLPTKWKSVSQGKRISTNTNDKSNKDVWLCPTPQEEIYLIAAKFYEYSGKMYNGTLSMAFLRTPDEKIADKYLDVTNGYMKMYEKMIGKYPYTKFALVENFWETGYGMPSFTLLGEKIIRFPFILYSSYPHELLHNWWGNSVYVDFTKGNWCEGITAYMADHLIKEQNGLGENYRRETLQKFTNMVNPDNDFLLSKFLSRNDGASEAIGYGKSLMMWHMLRRKLGDNLFLKTWQTFYKQYKFKHASFDDIRKVAEAVSGDSLKQFFNQFLYRKSAPKLSISNVYTDKYNNFYRIKITLKQAKNIFNIDVPIAVLTEKGIKTFVFNMNKSTQTFQINLKNKPLKLQVDPQYDVFRILDPREVPPALSKIWGSNESVIILPSKATKENYQTYKKFAEKWKNLNSGNYQITDDSKLETLPENKTAYILGFENKFVNKLSKNLNKFNSKIIKDSVYYQGKAISKNNNSFIFTVNKGNNFSKQILFVSIAKPEAIDGLVRKLPHYGKYGYLAFKGDEPVNIAKGQWSVINSPLVKVFDKKYQNANMTIKRKALAQKPTSFSQSNLKKTVKYMSSPKNKGRGLGTKELDNVADYIADAFKKAGLKPINNSYFQEFTYHFNDKGTLHLKNIVGIIEGTNPKLKNTAVVVSAHYDHLGLGWPDVHKGDKGKIHPGADDNASGVAILLELAKNISATTKPERTIIFVAFTGEEAGLIGSRYFVNHCKYKFFADINIDTDGSLFDKKLLVLNGNTAKEWKYIFMGTDYTTGIKSNVIDKELDSSDQLAFIEKQVPAIQLFTGATENYHRPTDTYEKLDYPGMVKVCTVAKEVIQYLADRTDPMPFTGKNATESKSHKTKGNRKVSTGSVPDFSYTGKGVKIGSIIANSPAEKAGLKVDDIIISVDKQTVNDLRTYSNVLKKYKEGDTINITVLRQNKKKIFKLKLTAR